MENQEIYHLLQQVYEGNRTPEQAMEDMDSWLRPEMQVGNYADIDLHRAARQGMPEVIYGEGKTAEQIAGIIRAMTGRGVKNIMTTRLSAEKAEEVARMLGGTVSPFSAKMESETGSETASEPDNAINSEETSGMDDAHNLLYDPTSRIGIANAAHVEKIGKVVVVAAGTSDLPVAEEATITAELNGSHVERVYDVGVAGLHRLLHRLPVLEDANVIVAVAGMEGALVSVVGGLVACPVIGVPTSVGYGANFGGAAALLSMLNSCASGVSVVNIDNGFGAGVLAARINRQSCKEK
ncbi:MAG: nickel pincer cofactor biosynthesis protein LarB [Lachnospiraceae bacterium]|nr:nickel pincer cofactor biosynthesis protein LarB [Lachnospiraceae bacterium]